MPCIPHSALIDLLATLIRRGAGADYGRAGASPWLRVDWQALRRRAEVGGVPVSYVDVAPAGPARGTVLFVHGLGASWPVWLEQLPAFAQAGYRAVALDLPGFGGSAMPREDISVAGYARTAAGLLERLATGPVHVVGHSLGGFVAAELAVRRPDLVERVVLAAPAVLWHEYRRSGPLVALAGTADVAARTAARLQRRRRVRESDADATGGSAPDAGGGRGADADATGGSEPDADGGRHGDPDGGRARRPDAGARLRGGIGGAAAVPVPRRPRLRALALGASGVHVPQRVPPEFQVELLRIARRTPGYLGALRALRGHDLRPELGTVAAPALIVWGDRDTLTGVEQLASLRELLPHAESLVLERTGHRVMIERPAAFNAAVLAFLGGSPA